MLYPNLNVKINNNKIISMQTGSTPGVYKIFAVLINVEYIIQLINFKNEGMRYS